MYLFVQLLRGGFLSSCNEEQAIELEQKSLKQGDLTESDVIVKMSYDIVTSRDFELNEEKYSELDLANMIPGNEKQNVTMELLENGTINMTINSLEFPEKIELPSQILPDDRPQITKTEIKGNSISFYDDNGNLISSTHIDIPIQVETVKQIKELKDEYTQEEINKTIATMQGHQYIENLDEFLKNNSQEKGITVIEQGDSYVTIRMDMSVEDSKNEHDIVLLIDKLRNKMVGNRIYGANDELLQTTYFGYNNGEQQYLSAIKTEQKMLLPSGKSVTLLTHNSIDNFKLDINIE